MLLLGGTKFSLNCNSSTHHFSVSSPSPDEPYSKRRIICRFRASTGSTFAATLLKAAYKVVLQQEVLVYYSCLCVTFNSGTPSGVKVCIITLFRFCLENQVRLEENQRAQFASQAAGQWLGIRLQMMGVAMVTAVAVIAVLEHHFRTVNPGMAGH